MAGSLLRTQVRNTFIDFPLSPAATPLPTPMASAPARSSVSVQESLLAAASEEPTSSTAIRGATSQRRLKPNPLNFLSQSSMMSIPESPHVFTPARLLQVRKDTAVYISGNSVANSMPPTPLMTWGVTCTPSGTPWGTPDARQTLSLVDMIQSPKVETKMVLLQSAYQHIYPHTAPGPAPTPVVAPPAATRSLPAPMFLAVAPAPPLPGPAPAPFWASQGHVAVPAAPAVPFRAPAASAAAPVATAPTVLAMGAATAPTACHSAASLLGLVSQTSSAGAMVAIGTIQPRFASVSAHPAVASQPGQAPMHTTVMASQHVYVPAGAPQPFMAVSGAPRRFVPPPPMAPAPMIVMSPKAATSPLAATAMSASDIKVLLDLAVASGNQQALDAVMRQANQAGMLSGNQRAYVRSGANGVSKSVPPSGMA